MTGDAVASGGHRTGFDSRAEPGVVKSLGVLIDTATVARLDQHARLSQPATTGQ